MNDLPLVFVHGFMGGSAQWELQRELGETRQLITVDLPGFGKNNTQSAPDRIAGFANYVLDELSRMNVTRFNLLGHSMGGMIVQEMIALAPERIEKLILYGTAATGNLPGRFETFERSKERVQEDGVQATARRISATWFLDYEKAEQFPNCANIAEQSSQQAMLASLDAMKSWSRTDNLQNISCPVCIIWGEADRTYRWPQVEQLSNKIPRANLTVLSQCAHAAHLEKPQEFNATVREFLDA